MIKLNQKLSEILESINEKLAEINPDDFTKEKEKQRLNDIMIKSRETSIKIPDRIYSM